MRLFKDHSQTYWSYGNPVWNTKSIITLLFSIYIISLFITPTVFRSDLIVLLILLTLVGFGSVKSGYFTISHIRIFSLYIILAIVTVIATLSNLFLLDIDVQLGQFTIIFRYLYYSILIAIVPIYLSRKNLWDLINLIIFCGVVVAIISLFQVYEIHYFNDFVTPYITEYSSYYRRTTGTFNGPNQLALVLFIPLYVLIGYFLTQYHRMRLGKLISKRMTGVYLISLFILAWAIVLTQSRGTILPGLISLVLILLLVSLANEVEAIRLREFSAAALILLIFIVIAITFIELERFTEMRHIEDTNLYTTRIPEMIVGFEFVLNRPLFGHGFTYIFLPWSDSIHGGLIRIFYHHGVVGAMAYLLIFIVVLQISYDLLTDSTLINNTPVAWGFAFGVLCTLVTYYISLPIRDFTTNNILHSITVVCIILLISLHIHYRGVIDQ